MFGLPKETAVNQVIPSSKIFLRAIQTPSLQAIYAEQIQKICWQNKLSSETYGLENTGFFREIEIFELSLHMKSIDKRLLRGIDRAIPYYIFHVLTWNGYYQALIANKRAYSGNIKVENYFRSCWMNSSQFQFVFEEHSLEKLYGSLKEQVHAKRSQKLLAAQQAEECNAFMNYFRTMKMTRSYKPVLILAVLEYGGSITVDQAADYFTRFYGTRRQMGLIPEFGNCIYAEENARRSAVCLNLIQNPIAALCRSGFFEYNEVERVFSCLPDIYDGLSLDEIDEIVSLCQKRLAEYFSRRG